jgi:DNA modification methylase
VDPMLRAGAAIYVFHPAGRNGIVFLMSLADRWSFRQTLVLRKDTMVLGHADYHYAHEPIAYANKPGEGRWGRGSAGWYGGNAETSVFDVARPRASREHPTAKPVELVARLVRNSSTFGDVVLDPFLGSGSTLIACEQHARRCFGVEIDPRYVDVAVARWEAFTGRRANKVRRRGR